MGILDEANKTLGSFNDSIESATKSLEDLNQKALGGGLTLSTLTRNIESSTKALSTMGKTIGDLGSKMSLGLDFGLISKGADKLTGVFEDVVGAGVEVVRLMDNVGKGIDGVTGYSRSLNASLFESVQKFNGSFEAAKKYADYITSTAQDFATAEFGFIAPADRIAAIDALAQAGIPLENMNEIITSSAGKMDLLNTSFLEAQALGMDLGSYMQNLGNAMLIQGLNTQEATEQMAMFGDVSKETSIRTDKVASSLQGLATQFSKMGLTASFGQPILEGFATTLTDLGLGFENALDLSKELGTALANLTSNYAAAYVTFQRGGLDFGAGGGALGASIGLRAEMLNAEQTGNQADLGMTLAGALKDTLSSFSGGQIVTVQEAAEDPKLQQTFFTQTQLLKDIYGISDPGAQDRTLDLLERLGDATARGDTELAASLGEDLQNVMEGRDETLGYQEKTAKFTEATFAELQFLNKNIIEAFRISGESLALEVEGFQKKTLEYSKDTIRGINNDPTMKPIDFGDLRGDLVKGISEGMKELSELDLSSITAGLAGEFQSALENANLNLDPEGALIALAGEISKLVGVLSDGKNGREPKGGGPI